MILTCLSQVQVVPPPEAIVARRIQIKTEKAVKSERENAHPGRLAMIWVVS
jgi:hypothetical protein